MYDTSALSPHITDKPLVNEVIKLLLGAYQQVHCYQADSMRSSSEMLKLKNP